MKKLLPILFLFCSSFCFSQYNGYTAKQDTCLNKKFSIAFYVLLDSTGTPFATPGMLQGMVNTLNDKFSRVCVEFMNCSIDSIPIYPYKEWYQDSVETAVTAVYYTPNTINIYIVNSTFPQTSNELEGYTYFPTAANLAAPKKDIIVLDGGANLVANNYASTLHMMGHFFGLPHTCDEIDPMTGLPWPAPAVPPPLGAVVSHEFASQSTPNCQQHGDGFCDTEADPNGYTPTQDGQGLFYILPVDNYMSFYGGSRNKYTAMQYSHMVYTIMTKRLYLH